MMFVFGACGNSSDDTASGDSGTAAAGGSAGGASGETAGDPYHIGYTNMGSDWILLYFQDLCEAVVERENPDNIFEAVNADYQTDKMQSGIQSLLSAGAQGINYYGIYSTLTLEVIQMCEEKDAVFAMGHLAPYEDQYDALLASKSFAGSVNADLYETGYQLGALAIEDGGSVAVVIAGPVGTPDMDAKLAGFTAGFEDNGGKVVGDEHCNFPTEAVDKSTNLLSAHPDVDTAYSCTGVFAIGMNTAIKNQNREINHYVSDLDSDLLDLLMDGTIKAGDGGSVVEMIMAQLLIMNSLEGNPILDESGKAPIVTDLKPLIITQDNADVFKKTFLIENPFTNEMIDHFLYSKNPDLAWADFDEFFENYDWDWFLEFRENTK
jgi:ribose transport system substrate-binding protein